MSRRGGPVAATCSPSGEPTSAGSIQLGVSLGTCLQEFTQLFGSLPLGVIAASLATGEASKYLAASDAFCRLTGYSWSELNGKDILTIIHPEEQPLLDELINSITAGKSTLIDADARIIDRNGNVLNTRLTGGVIEPSDGARYLAISCEDVTDATMLRSELGQLQDELAQSRRRESLGHLAEGIGHDFNNLLTVISSYSSLVQDEITIAEANQGTSRWGPVRWDVRQIEEATGRAKRLVAHLMAFTRQQRFEPQLADLDDQVSDAIALLDKVLGDQITISKQSGPALWQVNVDINLLRQAIINLALNARDARPANGQIEIAIEMSIRPTLTGLTPESADPSSSSLGNCCLAGTSRSASATPGPAWIRSSLTAPSSHFSRPRMTTMEPGSA